MRRGLRLFRRLARRDVAPRPDDFQRLAITTADQALLVVHPAIRPVLATKPVLDRVDPIVEEFRYRLLDPSQIIGVDPVAPEGRIPQVLARRIAEHIDDILAD